MKFIITVDTEADNQWKSNELFLHNIKQVPRFQELCDRYGFNPTYLVAHEVATDTYAKELFNDIRSNNRCEIGSHLHPWSTPPVASQKEVVSQLFPCELSDDDLAIKFKNLHKAVTDSFGIPTSFRSGRWGYDSRVGELLDSYGYLVDSSVTPYVDWRYSIKGGASRKIPNFLWESPHPSHKAGSVLSMPMTILPKDSSLVSRVGARVLQRGSCRVRWCRIYPETVLDDLIKVYETAKKIELPALIFMVHSSEFIVGTPYTKTNDALEHFFVTFEAFLKFLINENVQGQTLSMAAKEMHSF